MQKLTSEIHVNKCSCGWNFPALSEYETKCPQCRDIVQRCIDCGEEIEGNINKRYCNKCAKLNKKICNKYYMRDKRKYFKETIGDICNYDCSNCPYSRCILPVDPDDEQPVLFG